MNAKFEIGDTVRCAVVKCPCAKRDQKISLILPGGMIKTEDGMWYEPQEIELVRRGAACADIEIGDSVRIVHPDQTYQRYWSGIGTYTGRFCNGAYDEPAGGWYGVKMPDGRGGGWRREHLEKVTDAPPATASVMPQLRGLTGSHARTMGIEDLKEGIATKNFATPPKPKPPRHQTALWGPYDEIDCLARDAN